MKPHYLISAIFLPGLTGCVVAPQPAAVSPYGCQQTPAATADRGPSITCPQPNGTWVAANAPVSVGAIAQPPAPPVIVTPPPVIVAPPPVIYAAPYGYYGGGWGGGYYGGGWGGGFYGGGW